MIWYLLYQLWYQLQVVYNMLQSLFKKKNGIRIMFQLHHLTILLYRMYIVIAKLKFKYISGQIIIFH